MTTIFAICGILGGLLVGSGDILLDLKSKDNVKSRRLCIIDSAWSHMALWRFRLSILLTSLGPPLLFLGMTALVGQLMAGKALFGKVFWYLSAAAYLGDGSIRTGICLIPVIYKTLAPECGTAAEEAICAVYNAVKLPFCFLSAADPGALASGPLGIVRRVPESLPWYSLLTFLPLMLIGKRLEKTKHHWFYNLPHIVMPTASPACMGLPAIPNQR